jgi:hypothetical protein
MRFWALAEGVMPPENMTRCVANNYDIAGFWQNWHASYNLWLVRWGVLAAPQPLLLDLLAVAPCCMRSAARVLAPGWWAGQSCADTPASCSCCMPLPA